MLALGGGVVAATALLMRSRRANASTTVTPVAAWVFPVPSLGDREAVISDGFGSPRTRADGSKERHLGADLMYRRRGARDLIAVYPPGTVNGTKGYFMPDGVPALAVSAGVVAFAAWTPVGNAVIVRHANGWATYYTHLGSLAVARGEFVAAGQPIGIIGGSPADGPQLKHLHIELWERGSRSSAVDPAPFLNAWARVAISSWTPTARIAIAPRNAGFVYRPVGAPGEPYPEWLRRARGASGVYVIRERGGEVVYVGQSSTGRLFETATRHFQRWTRWKSYWKEEYARPNRHDPGVTYARDEIEVAIKITPPADALDEESRLIRRLRPRDNILGQPEPGPDLEEIPF